ncbi:MAG: HAMP domain-containing protein [Hymenobacteraceae bacterium]|nr:HAMP domain-containing protein [Hymenobacteraceae bacterium]
MPFRTKITLGFLALLLLLVGIGGYALYTVQRFDRASQTTQRANFYSIELGQTMLRALELMARGVVTTPDALPAFRQALTREAGNITEPGERELVDSLTQRLATYTLALAAPGPADARVPDVAPLRLLAHRMIALNVLAFKQKEARANQRAATARDLLTGGVTVAVLLALLLVLSVPAAAVAPLQLLQTAIRHAVERDFTQTIPIESRDEFGAVAADFNELLSQLREYRASTTAELLTERNRLAAVINTLDEGLILVDQNRTILLVNPVAAGLLGLPVSKLIGRPAAEVATENDLLRAALRPLDTPANVVAAAEALPLLTITPPEGGEALHYQLTAHDIVSFNEVRDQLEFAGYILALHNVSNFKKLDQVKSDFLATVSHELKTPLASINLSLKIIADERVAPDERRRVVSGIRQETQRLQKLVAELLDVARLESGNIVLDFRTVPVVELVRFATTPVQPQLAQKNLVLTEDLPADLPALRADPEKASWVLLNLLVNAIRYSPPGAPIYLAARREGSAVRFSVQDSGPGIAPEFQERIFQRFNQIPDKAGYRGGSGLGLSIAREFITAQGGRIWVESEPGAGSTFYFTLPTV